LNIGRNIRNGALRQVHLRAKPEAGHFSLAQEVEEARNDTEKFVQGSASISVNLKIVAQASMYVPATSLG